MAPRIGLGPVFGYEWVVGTRRWHVYALRSLFVIALLAGLIVTWWIMVAGKNLNTLNAQADVGRGYGYALVGIQLSLVILAAPAATAGAICMDKARGNLALLLMTDLSDSEIILGKLAARLVPVLSLIACSLPVLSIGTLLGGLDPVGMALAFLVTVDVAVLGCCLALAISVWALKVQEALMATYTVLTVALLAYPVWGLFARTGAGIGTPPTWLLDSNPFWLVYAPSVAPTQVSWVQFVVFTCAGLGLAGILTAISVAGLRRAAQRQTAAPARARRRFVLPDLAGRVRRTLPGPSLDANPVLWREWHRNQPSRWGRIIWAVYAAAALSLSAWGIVDAIANGVGTGPSLAVISIVLLVFVGLLLLSTSASTSLSEERVRQSLDVLMTTPLSTWSIVWGKWWGAFRIVPLLAFCPAALTTAVAFTWDHRPPSPMGWFAYGAAPGNTLRVLCIVFIIATLLGHGALITSLGLALATWVKKQARAVALVVVAYVLMTIAWPALIIILFERSGYDHRTIEGLTALSPVFATANIAESLSFRGREGVIVNLVWGIFWLIGLSAAAALLLAATRRTFDRCLGRMEEIPRDLGVALAKPMPILDPIA
jgi:ABC-type transport system involved in multi-copper enzyme maturation permease subunit